MSFNIGLSALNAAQEEISVTGNNIANASTNGFKSSRTEFADVYAASVLGGGTNQAGAGVGVQNIAQNFGQGNISYTDSALDLAINGNGFFILRGDSGNVYTRAGAFGTDQNGNIVNSLGEKLQGFATTADGKATGSLTDLVVTTGDIAPQATTLVTSRINLDAAVGPSSIVGSKVLTNGGTASTPQFGSRIAQPAVVAGKISVNGTDFSGTTAAKTTGPSNVSGGIDFNAATGAQGFSISVNGSAIAAIDLSAVTAADGAAVVTEVSNALIAAGFTGSNAVTVSLVSNRIVLQTAATGDSSRINISAVQGEAAKVVTATDVKGKTAPPTGFTITLDGISRDIVINKDYTNSGAAALALGGGAGSGNEALEDYIQEQIDTSAGLLGKVTVAIDADGTFKFQTTAAASQNLVVNPLTSVAGGKSFNQVVTFSTASRSGTLDVNNINFSTGNSKFNITVDGTVLAINLVDDFSTTGTPAETLGQFASSGLEAMEDEIQKQINASTLPGKVKVSIAADGRFAFEITDPLSKSLKVESANTPARTTGTTNVNSGFNFDATDGGTEYTLTITYDTGTETKTSALITLDQKYTSGQQVVDAIQNKINTDATFAFPLGQEQVRARLDPATGFVVIETVATGDAATLNVVVTPAPPGDLVVKDTAGAKPGVGTGIDFAKVATFTGSELNNTGKNAVGNGYSAETIKVVDNTGTTQYVSVAAGASANAVAQQFSNVSGITATASTVAYITATNSGDPENKGAGTTNVDANLPLKFTINGFNFEARSITADARLVELKDAINRSAGNLSARIVGTGVDAKLEITENNGVNLVFSGGTDGRGGITIGSSTRDAVTGEIIFNSNAPTQQIANLANRSNDGVVVGGVIELTLEENVTLSDATTSATGVDIPPSTSSIFGVINDGAALSGVQFELNTFDPRNADTYYRSTAVAIFDSVGIEHTMTQYYVKERPGSTDQSGSVWSVYFQIDGKDVGYNAATADTAPTLAKATLRFTSSGLYDPTQEPIFITNWTPLDSAGKPSGAGPVPGNTGVASLTNNSNFRIDLTKLTQFGGDFAVDSNRQNGFAKGQLTGLDINDRGAIFARFSNGQSKVLGEVALAKFADQSKLANAGGTRFTETGASGTGTPSGAGTAGLGVIQSGALEDSNVDLSEQLVQLIVSQRNFQAAAQIIESADTATQTIINL